MLISFLNAMALPCHFFYRCKSSLIHSKENKSPWISCHFRPYVKVGNFVCFQHVPDIFTAQRHNVLHLQPCPACCRNLQGVSELKPWSQPNLSRRNALWFKNPFVWVPHLQGKCWPDYLWASVSSLWKWLTWTWLQLKELDWVART